MKKSALRQCILLKGIVLFTAFFTAQAAPANFTQAKIEARQYVYHDKNHQAGGDLYCGCDWRWVGRSGGRMELESCGYEVRSQPVRAERLEWEHIVPASNFGRARQCWQSGGRQNCTANDPVFSRMEADLHNLAPSVGEVNADRQNFNFGFVETNSTNYGSCPFKVSFSDRTAEPKDETKGMVARVYFYMHDHYDLPMSRQQQQLLIQWNKQYPPTEWEKERDQRIAQRMGHHNPFVTGEVKWDLDHANSKAGLNNLAPPKTNDAKTANQFVSSGQSQLEIRGNRNSRVYHLPQGCPSYNRLAAHNIVAFQSEIEAQDAGFTKAGNCKP